MTTQHTPGPWVTDTCGEGKPFAIVTSTHLNDGPDDDVCEVYGGNDDNDAVRKANAFLIAAAPELLEALKDAFAVWLNEIDCEEYPQTEAKIRAAIAKATGGAK